jgi:hypothetical protein
MSESKKTLTLGNMRQLVDLNGDSTNFEISFKVTCNDDTPFYLLVVDQYTLDNNEELEYKKVKNSISGNIVTDENIYQNYFLILKSDTPCVVDIELTKKDLPTTVFDEHQIDIEPEINISEPEESSIPWNKIGLITVVLVIGLCVLWWMYKKNDSKSNNYSDNNDLGMSFKPKSEYTPYTISPISHSSGDRHHIQSSHNSSHDSSHNSLKSASSVGGSDNNSLLSRLKKFSH